MCLPIVQAKSLGQLDSRPSQFLRTWGGDDRGQERVIHRVTPIDVQGHQVGHLERTRNSAQFHDDGVIAVRVTVAAFAETDLGA